MADTTDVIMDAVMPSDPHYNPDAGRVQVNVQAEQPLRTPPAPTLELYDVLGIVMHLPSADRAAILDAIKEDTRRRECLATFAGMTCYRLEQLKESFHDAHARQINVHEDHEYIQIEALVNVALELAQALFNRRKVESPDF